MGSRLGTHGNGRRHAGRPVLSRNNHFNFPNHQLNPTIYGRGSPLRPHNAKYIRSKPNDYQTMKRRILMRWAAPLIAALVAVSAQAADTKPNIVFIMGDDVGMWNIGAYHRGMMAARTPNLD